MHLWPGRCVAPDPIDTLTDRLNDLLSSSGPGFILSLCPGEQYPITAPLRFTARDQEIRTAGYPTGSTRAMLVIDGPIVNGTGHTTAVDGTCGTCDGVKLRNVQINGTRLGRPLTKGGANIEMGGSNANQLIEYVRSFDPRGWSCLHVIEGNNFDCADITVQNNEIGPGGSHEVDQWADGISIACRDSLVRNNIVTDVTDGGIVIFGSPGTLVEGNIVQVEKNILLGGINMVDVTPFDGNFEGAIVTGNTIIGGFSSQDHQGSGKKGPNDHSAIIKLGIAIGPRTWFGKDYGDNVSTGGIVQGNQFTGAFSYAIAMSGVTNFTVEDNFLFGNTTFIGRRTPNCTSAFDLPPPVPFMAELTHVHTSVTQPNFRFVKYPDSLVACIMPPPRGKHWPITNALVPIALPIDSSELGYYLGPLIVIHGHGIDIPTIMLALFGVVFITYIIRHKSIKRLHLPVFYTWPPVGYVWQRVYIHLPFSLFRSNTLANSL